VDFRSRHWEENRGTGPVVVIAWISLRSEGNVTAIAGQRHDAEEPDS
jgi:hypothetical protein